MRSACALRIISGKIILFVVPKRLRAFRNYFFTGGAVKGNGICSAAFCESAALRQSYLLVCALIRRCAPPLPLLSLCDIFPRPGEGFRNGGTVPG